MPSGNFGGVAVEKGGEGHGEEMSHFGGVEDGVDGIVGDEENDAVG
jgi:hypothetical protein